MFARDALARCCPRRRRVGIDVPVEPRTGSIGAGHRRRFALPRAALEERRPARSRRRKRMASERISLSRLGPPARVDSPACQQRVTSIGAALTPDEEDISRQPIVEMEINSLSLQGSPRLAGAN